ncbi:hypothetical protein [Pandoraea sp. 64-18]|nr:hypothetical protein [Pandoraea sp. 64-18]
MVDSTAFPQAQEFHVSLRVADLAASTAFYTALFTASPKDTTPR